MLSISEFRIKTLNFCSMFTLCLLSLFLAYLDHSFIAVAVAVECVYAFFASSSSLLLPEFNLSHDRTSCFYFVHVRLMSLVITFPPLFCKKKFKFFRCCQHAPSHILMHTVLHWIEFGRFGYSLSNA